MDWQAWWAVEYLPGSSDRLHYMEQMANYYQALHSHNIAVDIVAPEADLSRYRLVVAPLLHLLRPGVAKNLEGFAAQGGTLLTNFFSGIVDQHDHVFLGGYPGGLRKLLGIHVEEYDPFTPEMHNELLIESGELAGSYPSSLWGELVHLEGAQALGVFASDYYAQQPALTVNQFGAGQAYYLATQSSPEFLAKLLQHLCQQAGVEPVLTAMEGVEASRRVLSDGRSVYFLLNHNEQVRHVALPVGSFTSLLTGKTVTGIIELAAVDADILLAE
jgi:beta-galactosidase